MKLKILISFMCVFCFSLISGQNTEKKSTKNLTITGFVLSPDNKPVEGAILYIDGVKTKNKTKTDGSFKIKITPSAGKLTARSEKFGFCEKNIEGQNSINMTLDGIPDKKISESSDTLSVSGGSGKVKKVPRTVPKKINTYTDIYQMIRGEVSGVVVSGRSVRIQQGHSFFGSSEPLYVVNGHIVSNIDFVVPLEVKSIKILKGSEAAIYGLQGSNGVISITLKNGTER